MVDSGASAGLWHTLHFQMQQVPHAPAILGRSGEWLTYAALNRRVATFGTAIARAGLGRSDRVALVGAGADLAVGVLGVSCHAVAAPLDPNSTATELKDLLNGLK